MLPLRVGGAELSLTERFLLSPRLAEFQDQLPKVSTGGAPFENVGGGGVAGLECDCGCEGP
jgi:hypothetical protein